MSTQTTSVSPMVGTRLTKWLVAMMFLSQCAAKHQPTPFSAHFPPGPETELSSNTLEEMSTLQSKESLNALEKRRLIEILTLEQRLVGKKSPRFKELETAISQLGQSSDNDKDLQETLEKVRAAKQIEWDSTKTEPPALSAFVKKEHSKVLKLWNDDRNAEALDRLDKFMKSKAFTSDATTWDRLKAHHLEFRLAVDLENFSRVETAYAAMKEADRCHELTSQSGLILSLFYLQGNQPKKALENFQNVCDRDDSPNHLAMHAYWEARFREANGENVQKEWKKLGELSLPSFYVYLAKRKAKEATLIPKLTPTKSYFDQPLSLSSEVKGVLSQAESRIAAGLKKEAEIFLRRATQLLVNGAGNGEVYPLLYTAHLYQAAGYHLDALRIHSFVTSRFAKTTEMKEIFGEPLLKDIFPSPFQADVESLAHHWQIDPDYVYAIMRQESAFIPTALSPAKARGLMQLMPSLARSIADQWGYRSYYSDKMLFFAPENLKLATYHLNRLQSLIHHPALIAAAYNAGYNRMQNWWKRFGQFPLDSFIEIIPVTETRNYVKLVLRNYVYYHSLRQGGGIGDEIIQMQLPVYGQIAPAVAVSH